MCQYRPGFEATINVTDPGKALPPEDLPRRLEVVAEVGVPALERADVRVACKDARMARAALIEPQPLRVVAGGACGASRARLAQRQLHACQAGIVPLRVASEAEVIAQFQHGAVAE
jgi:hypothetical protein